MSGFRVPEEDCNETGRMVTGDSENEIRRSVWRLAKRAFDARRSGAIAGCMAIDGQITEADAKRLILKKLHDIANKELLRYLNAEKRHLITAVENLWDKYAVSSQVLEQQHEQTISTFSQFMTQLKYLPTTTQ
jgi:hypothetical protein